MTGNPAQAPTNSAGPAPIRRATSLRRTSSLDVSWPEGRDGPMLVEGEARDAFTGGEGQAPVIVDGDRLRVVSSRQREIMSISADRREADLQALVGARGGGHFRTIIAEALPDEIERRSPLSFLLDDFSGASLVSPWAWMRWENEFRDDKVISPVMEGICSGFRPGSPSLMPDGRAKTSIQSSTKVNSLVREDDPAGWHRLDPQLGGPGMRRARRIDLWFEGDTVCMDVGFQDSAVLPEGGRAAVHEYHVVATADRDMILRSVVVEPRVLPYVSCPAASGNADRMVGTNLSELGSAVPRELHGILGCTHLNDVLRLLSHVPKLSEQLHKHINGNRAA